MTLALQTLVKSQLHSNTSPSSAEPLSARETTDGSALQAVLYVELLQRKNTDPTQFRDNLHTVGNAEVILFILQLLTVILSPLSLQSIMNLCLESIINLHVFKIKVARTPTLTEMIHLHLFDFI